MESGDKSVRYKKWDGALLICCGADPYKTVDTAVQLAAQLSGTSLPREKKVLPKFIDLFGWCTWDAFYSKVSAAGVEDGLKALRSCGVQPGFVVIDDGWQVCVVAVFSFGDFRWSFRLF